MLNGPCRLLKASFSPGGSRYGLLPWDRDSSSFLTVFCEESKSQGHGSCSAGIQLVQEGKQDLRAVVRVVFLRSNMRWIWASPCSCTAGENFSRICVRVPTVSSVNINWIKYSFGVTKDGVVKIRNPKFISSLWVLPSHHDFSQFLMILMMIKSFLRFCRSPSGPAHASGYTQSCVHMRAPAPGTALTFPAWQQAAFVQKQSYTNSFERLVELGPLFPREMTGKQIYLSQIFSWVNSADNFWLQTICK